MLHETAKVCVCPLTLGVLGVLDVVVPRGGLKKKPAVLNKLIAFREKRALFFFSAPNEVLGYRVVKVVEENLHEEGRRAICWMRQ